MRLALLAPLLLAGCDAVLDIPDRVVGPNVACDGGDCGCITDTADCDHDPTNGCEVHLQSDAENCGACGHDCRGKACSDGICQATSVAAACVNSLAIAGDDVLWTACSGGLWSSASAAPLADVDGFTTADGPVLVGADAIWLRSSDFVPWEVMTTPIGGGATAKLQAIEGGSYITGLAAAAGRIFWAAWLLPPSPSATRFSSMPVGGGAVRELGKLDGALGPIAVSADGTRIAYFDGKSVQRFDVATRSSSVFAADADQVMTDGDAFILASKRGVLRAQSDAAPAVLVATDAPVSELAAGAGAIAWTEEDRGDLFERSPDGAIFRVATELPLEVNGLAVGERWIAWASDREIFKVAR